jgi:Flp pilus assembly protein TadD
VTSEAVSQSHAEDAVRIVRAYLETGNYERAREVVRRSLSENPNDAVLLGLCAQAELLLENYSTAAESAFAALAITPDDLLAMRIYALALDELGRRDEALRMAYRTVIAHPNEPVAHWVYARLLYDARVLPSALVVVQEALRLSPTYVSALVLRGCILEQMGRVEESTESYREALVLDPDNASAVNNIAVNRLRRSKFTRALDGFLSAASLDPALGSKARTNIGLVLAKMLSRIAIIATALGVTVMVVGVDAAKGSPTAGARVLTGLITAALIAALCRSLLSVPRRILTSVMRKRPGIGFRIVHVVVAAGIGSWITVFGRPDWFASVGLILAVYSLFLIKVDP